MKDIHAKNRLLMQTVALSCLLTSMFTIESNAQPFGVYSEPQVVQAVAPSYPVNATVVRASGTVIVEVQVDARGAVTSTRIIESHKLLDKAAESGARRWVFAAADDEKGSRVARLSFTFKLMPSDASADDLLPVFMPPYQVEVRRAVPVVVDSPNIDPPLRKRAARTRKKT